MSEEKIKHFVRVANTDLIGGHHLLRALCKIRGVGPSFAHAICSATQFDPATITGTLSEEAIARITVVLEGKEIPVWMRNHQNSFETGNDLHLVSTQLRLTEEFIVKRMRRLKSYKGRRHSAGLPVRGQRTKSNFRKGRSVGVKRKK